MSKRISLFFYLLKTCLWLSKSNLKIETNIFSKRKGEKEVKVPSSSSTLKPGKHCKVVDVRLVVNQAQSLAQDF